MFFFFFFFGGGGHRVKRSKVNELWLKFEENVCLQLRTNSANFNDRVKRRKYS